MTPDTTALQHLTVFELSPIGVNGTLEAVRVFYFCTDHCREEFMCALSEDQYRRGVSTDMLAGTVCDECGDAMEVTV